MRCAIYVRVSTEDQVNVAYGSLERQRELCEAYINIRRDQGWNTVKFYSDAAYSGGTLDRPGMQQLIADAEARRFDVIVAYKLDRITRSLKDFYALWEILEAHHVSIATASEQFDTSTPTGKLMLNILLSFGQFERELIRERVMMKIEGRARKGMWNGGTLPLGYRYDKEAKALVVDDAGAEIVRFIFQRIIETGSPSTVANEANARGYRSRSWEQTRRRSGEKRLVGGRRFDEDYVKRIVQNGLYKGYVNHRQQLYKGLHEPIIDEETWQLANEMFGATKLSGVKFRDKHVHRLKGVMKCATCGTHMPPYASGKKNKDGSVHLYYSCSNVIEFGKQASCPVRFLPAREIEEAVIKQLSWLGKSPDLLDECVRAANGDVGKAIERCEEERAALHRRLSEIGRGVARIVAYIAAHDSVPKALQDELTKLHDEQKAVDQRIEKLTMHVNDRKQAQLDVSAMRQQLERFDALIGRLALDEQKELISLLVREVRVWPGARDGKIVVRQRRKEFSCEVDVNQLPITLPFFAQEGSGNGRDGSAYGIRTRGLRLERAVS